MTITGNAFVGATGVSFGGTAASFVVNSNASITATAPAGNAGQAVGVYVTTVAGTASAGNKFTYAPKKTAKGKSKGKGSS